MSFPLDPRLAADTLFVGQLKVCDLLIMNESRYPWAILVPRISSAEELHDLDAATRDCIFEDMMKVSEHLARFAGVEKINTGALGNIVRQLHIHIIGRCTQDPAWPGPVWGHSPRLAYENGAEAELLRHLKALI
jgi:diadenosine tetraphosphate (Ap4A) HIT family hydrolase